MEFVNAAGAIVPTRSPVIGAVVGGRPLVDQPLPEGIKPRPREETTCPYKLVADITATFKKACTTAQERKKAAQDNKTDQKSVDQECKDLQAFLKTQ